MKKFVLLIAFFTLSQAYAQQKQWIRSTFAGQGHVENRGPWLERQGSDRAEWVSAFGVSPVIPEGDEAPLMLQITDLSTLQFSSDGKEFKRANMPLTRGGAVGFNPHDGNIGYALMEGDPKLDLGGWWRTENKGETWEFMLRAPSVRGQRNVLLEVNPNASFKNHIYIAAGIPTNNQNNAAGDFSNFEKGLYRSTDNGATWSVVDFSGEEIYQIRFSKDGSVLYVVTYPGGTLNDTGGSLYALTFEVNGTDYTKQLIRDNVRNMDVDPQEASKGFLLDQDGILHAFTDFGASVEKVETLGKKYRFVEVNPANNQHVILYTSSPLQYAPFIWSNDGGTTWNRLEEDGDYFATWYDYAPINHFSEGYRFKKAAGGGAIIDGTKDVFAFWPGDSAKVLNWATNIQKGPMMSPDYGHTFKPFAHGGSFKGTEGGSMGDAVGVMGLAKNEYGFVLTKNNGISWKGISVLSSSALEEIYLNHPNERYYKKRNGNSLDFNPTNNDIIIGTFALTPTHIVRSEDFGKTWESIAQFDPTDFDNPEKENPRATNVFWHNQNANIVYAGSMKSTDGGKTFSQITDKHFVTDMHEKNGDVVLSMEVPSEIYLSYDAGETWGRITIPPGESAGNLVAVTASKGRSYAFDLRDEHDPAKGGKVRILAGGEFGVYAFVADASDAYTGTWTALTEGFDASNDPYLDGAPYFYSHVAVDQRPGHHNNMYVLTGGTRGRRSYYRQAYHSADYGATWKAIMHDSIPGSPHYVSAQWSDVDWHGNFIYNDHDGLFMYTDMISVDVTNNIPDGGEISGETKYAYREMATLTATPNQGFEFIAWEEKDEVISTSPTLTFNAYRNRNLTAVFSDTSNKAPFVVTPISDFSIEEDAEKQVVVTDVSAHFEDPEKQTLTYKIASDNEHVIASLNNTAVEVEAMADFFGSASLVLTASDNALSVADSFKVEVMPVNDPPEFSISTNSVALSANFGESIVTVSPAEAAFGEEQETVQYALSPASITFAQVVLEAATGKVTFTSIADSVGTANFTLTADDGQSTNNQFEQTFSFTVTGALGLEEDIKNTFILYPNPVSSTLNISFDGNRPINYTISGLDGKLWISDKLKTNEAIDIRHLPRGMYLFIVENELQIPFVIQR